jgi:hypothetical protein
VRFASTEAKFVGVRDTGHQRSYQYVAQFRVIVHKREQRLIERAGRTYAQQVFGSRIEFDDEEIMIQQNDGRGQTVDDACRKSRVSVAVRSG